MLTSGTRLGLYEILALIGKGGMGEVYRARDSKLGREVAIKILPQQLAREPERLARFQREARLLASLNHPNIATIHGLEESSGTHFLVMEMVTGETLQERIGRDGPFPIEETLDIAKQICEALEHAHEKNVIHRDLKPANVKLTPEGKVKVLDFGLAKAFAADPASNVLDSNSPTAAPGASPTLPGVILGTAAYMSPEQARGKTVDRRTDIWALGCVLYELLTAQQVFAGENVTEILANVLKAEPEWSTLPADTPPGIRAVLRRCLQKDVARRLRDAADLRLQTEDTRAASSSVSQTVTAPASAPAPRRWLLLGTLACLVVAALAGLAVWKLKPSPPQPVTRTVVDLPTDERFPSTSAGLISIIPLALSPDGRTLLYAESMPKTGRDLFTLPLDGDRKPRVFLQTPFNETSPRLSPDGRYVAYVSDESGRYEVYVQPFPGPGGKYQISTEGGTEMTWGAKGEIFYRSGNKMIAVEVKTQPTLNIGKPQVLFEGNYVFNAGPGAHYDVTPDGQRFLMIKADDEQAAAFSQINVVLNWFEELKQKVPAK